MTLKSPTFVLDPGLNILYETHWTKVMVDIMDDELWVLKTDPTTLIRSQYLTFEQPIYVVQVDYYHFVYHPQEEPSMEAILKRDKGRCIYCNGKAKTVDHIIPKSKGGPNTWRNLAGCCIYHNQLKADRTPEEAGLKMLWTPDHVDPLAKEQRRVRQYVDSLTHDEYNTLYRSR